MSEAKKRPLGAVGEPPKRQEGITLRFGQITRQEIVQALRKLDEFTGWTDSKDFYRFAKFKGYFDREEKKAGIWYRKLIDKHSEKVTQQKMSKITGKLEDMHDADGKVVTKPKYAPNNMGQMSIVMADQKAFNADIKIFDNHKFTVNVYRFKADDLRKAGLTPVELRACAKLVDDLPEDMAPDDSDDEILREELQSELDEDEDPSVLEEEPQGDVGEAEDAPPEESDGDGGAGDQPTQ